LVGGNGWVGHPCGKEHTKNYFRWHGLEKRGLRIFRRGGGRNYGRCREKDFSGGGAHHYGNLRQKTNRVARRDRVMKK